MALVRLSLGQTKEFPVAMTKDTNGSKDRLGQEKNTKKRVLERRMYVCMTTKKTCTLPPAQGQRNSIRPIPTQPAGSDPN